jgi:hypothetical protein
MVAYNAILQGGGESQPRTASRARVVGVFIFLAMVGCVALLGAGKFGQRVRGHLLRHVRVRVHHVSSSYAKSWSVLERAQQCPSRGPNGA